MQMYREVSKYVLTISVTDGVDTWHAESLIEDPDCIQEYLQQLCEELMYQILLLDQEIERRMNRE
jgi:asparagine synthetase A